MSTNTLDTNTVRRWKRYPEYLPTGIDWFATLPSQWQVRPLKRMASLRSGENITAESITPEGDYPVYGGNRTSRIYVHFHPFRALRAYRPTRCALRQHQLRHWTVLGFRTCCRRFTSTTSCSPVARRDAPFNESGAVFHLNSTARSFRRTDRSNAHPCPAAVRAAGDRGVPGPGDCGGSMR